MLEEHQTVLQEPYGAAELSAGEGPDRIAQRLGVPTPQSRALAEQIANDLDAVNFGIGWWREHLDPPRRILISDQLVLDADGVARNLLEATVHRLEAEQAWEQQRRQLLEPIRQGVPMLPVAAPRSAVDDLAHVMADLHIAGTFRAVGSALDCFAGVVIGVAALPQSILRADFANVRRWLADQDAADVNLASERRRLGARLEAVIDSAGPPGWLTWAIDMRNMFEHRGRRLTIVIPREVAPGVLVPRSAADAKLQFDHLLARDPGRSEMEVLRDSAGLFGAMLSEHAGLTLTRLVASTTTLVEEISDFLAGLWQRRRAAPNLLGQPLEQWPTIEPSRSPGFSGYSPGAAQLPANGQLHLNPLLGERMRAAALLDQDRQRWVAWLNPPK